MLLIPVIALIYFVVGKAGLGLALVHPSASAVWPATGVALAAVLIWGSRVWPAIFLGALFVNITTAGSLSSSLGIALGNTLESLAGGWFVNRFANGCKAFDRPQDFFKFVLLAGFLSTTLSPTLGVTSLSLAGFADWAQFLSIWTTWWIGDLVGAILVAPLLILWWEEPHFLWKPRQWLEVVALLALFLPLTFIIFGELLDPKVQTYFYPYMCFPFPVWAALRFGSRETATVTVLLVVIAIWETMNGFGPFAHESTSTSLVFLQIYSGFVGILGMLMAAVVVERRQSARELERLSRVKSDFVTMVTHELRTPLASILEGINLVADGVEGPASPGQQETLSIVKRNVDRLGRLVTNVLDFQKLNSEIGRLDFAEHDLKLIIADVCEMMRFEVEKKGINLKCELPETPVLVTCDGDRIRQVLINLVENAIKFVDRKGSIRVQLQALGAEEDTFRLIVQDTGVGIKPADREKIFEMFSQSFAGSNWRPGGFGVGLAVCKKIMDLHGGRIWVESEEGSGSRFILEFRRRWPALLERSQG